MSSINKPDLEDPISQLEIQIKDVRRKMQTLWPGHTDEAVLNASIELDELLNEYQKAIVEQATKPTAEE